MRRTIFALVGAALFAATLFAQSTETVPQGKLNLRSELSAQRGTGAEAPASPFGLWMGLTREQVGTNREERQEMPYHFLLSSVPKPHPDLGLYFATVTPKAGLCRIFALTNTLTGSQFQAKFGELRQQIESVYGSPLYLDVDGVLKQPSPSEVMDYLKKRVKEGGILQAIWTRNDLPMKPTLGSVSLTANADDKGGGMVSVDYHFTNYDQCQAEFKAVPKSVF